MSSEGPQGGFASQNGSSFNSTTAGTGAGGQQQGFPQQTPPRGPTRKEAAAVHDPFAALTGEHCCLYCQCFLKQCIATSRLLACRFDMAGQSAMLSIVLN